MKRFLILSDGKTVRELTKQEHMKMFASKRNYKTVCVHKSEISISTKENVIWISREQLVQVLESWKNET